uniref:EXS domain-containing protein n=1 Tax=Amphimedon queenslandica TaxID=400682 RepID=A0A1X7TB78_AMPQE
MYVRILFPYYDVSFPDFWIADQLNSLAIVLLDMQYFICYLVYGQNATTGKPYS